MAVPAKRPRIALTIVEKKELCQYKASNPALRLQDLSEWCVTKFDKHVAKNTISDILKQRQKWMNMQCNASILKKEAIGRHPELERALWLWFSSARVDRPDVNVSDAMLLMKARKFGEELGVTGLQYSHGWISRFRARHGIRSFATHGEKESADPATVFTGRQTLKKDLSSYSPNDIYNMDETSLFFRLQPGQTLSTEAVKGCKRSKDRITVALCVNSTGTHRLRPFVIGKARNPRCFRGFKADQYVDYFSNAKAWMTAVEFKDFLEAFDRWAKKNKRNLALIVDNAPSHKEISTLTNIRLFFLPPNVTSVLQPLDAGIIRSFKAQYRNLLSLHLLDLMDEGRRTTIDLRQALIMVAQAWQKVRFACFLFTKRFSIFLFEPQVTTITVVNCWTHVDILPNQTGSSSSVGRDIVHQRPERERFEGLKDLQNTLLRLSGENQDAAVFVDVDAAVATTANLTDEEIVNLMRNNNDEPDDESPSPLPSSAARLMCHDLVRYFESQGNHDGAQGAWSLLDAVNKSAVNASKQTNIEDFFKRE